MYFAKHRAALPDWARTWLLVALCAARGATSSCSPRCPCADGTDASSLVQAWVHSSVHARQEPQGKGHSGAPTTSQPSSSPEDGPLDAGTRGGSITPQASSNVEDETRLPATFKPADRKPGFRQKAEYGYNSSEWDRIVPHIDLPDLTPSDAGKVNLCMYGHFVPELVLIGAVKAATTTFAGQFAQSPGSLWAKKKTCEGKEDDFCMNGTTKEGHHFDFQEDHGPTSMAYRYPECRSDIRLVATDMSPRYMVDPMVPLTIRTWYEGRSPFLKFVVVLREPVERFHSDYYHAVESDWCPRYAFYTFEELVRSMLELDNWHDLVGGSGSCTDRLQASKYTEELRRWFDIFTPRQFTMIPMKYVTDPGMNGRPNMSVASYMWSMLGIAQGRLKKEEEVLNDRKHPSLLQDLGRVLLDRFRTWLYVSDGPRILASFFAHRPEVNLYGYVGQWDNAVGITVWLVENW